MYSSGFLDLIHQHGHSFSHLCGVVHDMNASLLEGSDLVESATLATGDDSTSVTHSSAWRSGLASDERNNREVPLVVLREPFCGFFFGLTTDLTDHNDTVSFGVNDKALEDIDEVGAVEGISTDTDDS